VDKFEIYVSWDGFIRLECSMPECEYNQRMENGSLTDVVEQAREHRERCK
jgi:hypothetical protein